MQENHECVLPCDRMTACARSFVGPIFSDAVMFIVLSNYFGEHNVIITDRRVNSTCSSKHL